MINYFQSPTSFNHPISLLRVSGCLCSHLLCMKPSILSCLKIMVRWGYGPRRGSPRRQIHQDKSLFMRLLWHFGNTMLPSSEKSCEHVKFELHFRNALRSIVTEVKGTNLFEVWSHCRWKWLHTRLFYQSSSCAVWRRLKKGLPPKNQEKTSFKITKKIKSNTKNTHKLEYSHCIHRKSINMNTLRPWNYITMAYIFKEAVISLWRSLLQRLVQGTDRLVVEDLVEAQFFEESHLGVRPR